MHNPNHETFKSNILEHLKNGEHWFFHEGLYPKPLKRFICHDKFDKKDGITKRFVSVTVTINKEVQNDNP